MHPLRALRERGNNTPEEVSALLSDDIEFHTPILTKVVTGREVISRIWALSSHVRSGRYVREDKLDDHTTFLQWQGQIDGRDLEILELIEDDDRGLIRKRTAAYRPLPAVELFRAAIRLSRNGSGLSISAMPPTIGPPCRPTAEPVERQTLS